MLFFSAYHVLALISTLVPIHSNGLFVYLKKKKRESNNKKKKDDFQK